MPSAFDLTTSSLASSLRGWRGTTAFHPAQLQPEKNLELYDIEACPFCRLVREALTEFDLDALILPCPVGGERYRPRCEELGGRQQFPFLVDPNTGGQLYESADIIDYLANTYQRPAPGTHGLRRRLAVATSLAASAVRYGHGRMARPSRAPDQPLELFSFESSPNVIPVRERLCELELPYLLRNTGKGRWTDMGPPALRDRLLHAPGATSRNRKLLFERTGRVQVPYLIDPNTGVEMFESTDILAYLDKTYAA